MACKNHRAPFSKRLIIAANAQVHWVAQISANLLRDEDAVKLQTYTRESPVGNPRPSSLRALCSFPKAVHQSNDSIATLYSG